MTRSGVMSMGCRIPFNFMSFTSAPYSSSVIFGTSPWCGWGFNSDTSSFGGILFHVEIHLKATENPTPFKVVQPDAALLSEFA
ncbi:MAG: hypothetical protein QW292_04380 [Candidatus Parvarchaeota archaeon]